MLGRKSSSSEFVSPLEGSMLAQGRESIADTISFVGDNGVISVPDLRMYLRERAKEIAHFVGESNERLQRIEGQTMDFCLTADSTVVDRLFNSRRIINALKDRIERIKEVIRVPSLPNLIAAQAIIDSDLILPKDTVNSLLDAPTPDPIKAGSWNKVVNQHLDEVEFHLRNSLRKRKIA